MKEALFTMPSARVTWLCALFLLGYVGIEVALGGWITTFMLRERQGSAFASGMTATGFWLGITVGRLVLGFVTPRIGEKLSIAIYLPLATGLELLFWLVPQFYVSAVAVALQGFFLGPLFPAAVVATTKLLPKHLHVSGIGFAAAFGAYFFFFFLRGYRYHEPTTHQMVVSRRSTFTYRTAKLLLSVKENSIALSL
jgi:fucose permease